MYHRHPIGMVLCAVALTLPAISAPAQDMSKFPTNWEGQWGRGPGMKPSVWDVSKPPGPGQQAPLTPEYQVVMEANAKAQSEGNDIDPKSSCYPPGMPRVMSIYQPMEIIIKPKVTYFLLESTSPIRRVWTDGRGWPETFLPAFAGYSIGHWEDEDGDGKYDTLYIETRGISGPRQVDANIPLDKDDSTVVKEKLSLDKSNPNIMNNEITTIDDAFTKPWTVVRKYQRRKEQVYAEYNCEDKRNILINNEDYWISVDGYLMPTAKGQKAPDLKYFKDAVK